MVRTRFRVTGTVQGVGFRPFVFRRAAELGLSGFVRNDSAGVARRGGGRPRRHRRVRPCAVRRPTTARPCRRGERRGRRAAVGRSVGSPSNTARISARPAVAVSVDTAPCPACLGSCSTPRIAATATRSRTAPTAGRATRSCDRVPYDRPIDDDGRIRDVLGVPARVRRPGRPPLPRPTERLPCVRAAGLRGVIATGRRLADARCRGPTRPSARCATAR